MNTFKVSEFTHDVISKLDYYVYRLIDPRNGETFYVGKGKGNRMFQHIKCALKDKDNDAVDLKYKKIREIQSAGLDIIHVVHRHGLDKDTSLQVEAALIDAYPGTTNIAGGYGSNDYGPMNAFEIITRYAAQEAIFQHNVLMITINRSITEKSIYDATRFSWKVNLSKAEKAQYILAVEKGIIVGVFTAQEWKQACPEHFPGLASEPTDRYGFIGEEADEQIKNLYLRKRIPDQYRKKGAANPIKYSW